MKYVNMAMPRLKNETQLADRIDRIDMRRQHNLFSIFRRTGPMFRASVRLLRQAKMTIGSHVTNRWYMYIFNIEIKSCYYFSSRICSTIYIHVCAQRHLYTLERWRHSSAHSTISLHVQQCRACRKCAIDISAWQCTFVAGQADKR